MTLLDSNAIAGLNTLALPSECRSLRTIADPADMLACLAGLDEAALGGIEVAGELSNTVVGDAIDADLILFRDGAVRDVVRSGGMDVVTVDGSCAVDRLVETLVGQGVPGIELLSGIPGTVGAGIVQNIAAYGQQFSAHFVSARAFDIARREVVVLTPEDFGFSYRSSSLKKSPRYMPGRIVLDLVLEFPAPGVPDRIAYQDLAAYFPANGLSPDDLAARRSAVLAVRQQKGMVAGGANWVPSAGSFFLSPVLPAEAALRLVGQVRGQAFADNFLSWYNPDAEFTRVPAALVMRAAGFMNGDRWGDVGLSPHHILALCSYPGARGSDVLALSRLVRAQVERRFGLALEPEVRFLGRADEADAEAFLAGNPFVPGAGEPAWAKGLGVPDKDQR